jgi:tight adherence protein B
VISLVVVAAAATGLASWLALPPPPAVPGRPHSWRGGLLPMAGLLLVLPARWVAPALVLALAVVGGVALWRRRARARRAEQTADLMAEVCDVLAAELAAGRPAETALEEAAQAWREIRPVAFREVLAVPGAGRLRLLAAAWSVSHRTGGGLAAAIRRVADAVRREQATRRVVAGELASARATARLMAGLPGVALLMGSGAGGDPWAILFGTPLGLACLAAGLALGFAGLWWIELIAREVDR